MESGLRHHGFATSVQSNFFERHEKGRRTRHLDRQWVGVEADRVNQMLNEEATLASSKRDSKSNSAITWC